MPTGSIGNFKERNDRGELLSLSGVDPSMGEAADIEMRRRNPAEKPMVRNRARKRKLKHPLL